MPGWSGWGSLGGQLGGGAPAVAENADGRLEVFADGNGPQGPELWHIWQNPTPATGWSAWESLGAPPGQFLGSLEAGRNGDGRLEVFGRVGLMSAGVAWHIWQQPVPATGWSGWDVLGAPPGGVAARLLYVGRNADGRLELFVLGSAGDVWHIWQQPSPGSGWSSWDSLGAPAGASLIWLAIGQNTDGRLELFAIGTDGALWHTWQQPPPATGWSSWASLGAPAGASLAMPAVGRNADGRLEAFAVADQDTLWHIWQTSPGGGWSGWNSLGTPPGAAFLVAPTVGENADGRLEVFITEMNGELWHIWQNLAPGTGWSGWESLGGEPHGQVGVGRNADGRLEVFAVAREPQVARPLWHRWQVSPNAGWSVTEDWELTALTTPCLELFTPSGGAVYARTTSGLFRSSDQGQTWIAVNLPPSPGRLAVDPTDASIIYASGAGGLFKTTNHGATWTLVRATPNLQTIAVAVSAADHHLVYLALARGSDAFQFLRSVDGGASWTVLQGPTSGTLCGWSVLILEPHPGNPQRVFRTSGCYAGRNVPFGDTLDQSVDRGATWTSLFHPQPLFPSRLVGGAGATPGRFYLGAHFGAPPGGGRLFRSDDDGASWTPVLVFPSGPSVRGLTYDPTTPDRAYAGLTSGEVKTTADAGATWTDLGRSGLGQIEDLALSLNRQHLFAASDQGVWRLRR